MTERERAEQLWQKLTRLEVAQDAQDIYIAREYVDLIVAFSREERARVLEQMRNILMESEDFDYYLDWISDQITKLREEGRGDE